jgi:hypothetical protein
MYSSLSAAEAERRRETRRDCVQPAIGSSLAVEALVEYFRILQEWSLKAQPEGLVGDQHVVSGTPAKIRKRR